MIFSKVRYTVFISGLLLLFACQKDKDFPSTPQLNVREFSRVGPYEVIWRIGFTDGDGDFGVRNDDDPDNFIVTLYSIEDGVAIEKLANNYRVPQIEDVPTNKGVEGEFRFRIDGLDLFLIEQIDSVYYRGFAVDRTGNRSNTVETPWIAIN